MTHTKPLAFGPALTNLMTDIFESSQITEELFGNNNFLKKPASNITELENQFVVELLVPGYNKTDFKIAIEKNELHVSTNLTAETTEKTGKNIRTEFTIGNFKRSYSLGESVDAENVSAQYTNGILSITLLKKEKEAPLVKEIVVN